MQLRGKRTGSCIATTINKFGPMQEQAFGTFCQRSQKQERKDTSVRVSAFGTYARPEAPCALVQPREAVSFREQKSSKESLRSGEVNVLTYFFPEVDSRQCMLNLLVS